MRDHFDEGRNEPPELVPTKNGLYISSRDLLKNSARGVWKVAPDDEFVLHDDFVFRSAVSQFCDERIRWASGRQRTGQRDDEFLALIFSQDGGYRLSSSSVFDLHIRAERSRTFGVTQQVIMQKAS